MVKVAMIGGTGLIGADLAQRLVTADHQLLLLGRRPSGISGAQDLVSDVADWPAALADKSIDVAISTLGTTRKAAGSMVAFEAIDRHAVVSFARAAHAAGARHWMMVSSVGADPRSRSGYLAVKGRAECDVRAIGFARADIFRPGLLVGDRTERRPVERLAMRLSPLLNRFLVSSLDRYRAIPASAVASAMAKTIGAPPPGNFIHYNRDIRIISGL